MQAGFLLIFYLFLRYMPTEVSLILVVLIYVAISIITFPFFKDEGLFWWRTNSVPFWAWILHNIGIGFLLYASVVALMFLMN